MFEWALKYINYMYHKLETAQSCLQEVLRCITFNIIGSLNITESNNKNFNAVLYFELSWTSTQLILDYNTDT